MNQLEENIQESFTLVKNDIIKLQKEMIALSQAQLRTVELINSQLQKSQKIIAKREESFLASEWGKKFHMPKCPFALNIKPKFAIRFKIKDAALNRGYSPCRCVK